MRLGLPALTEQSHHVVVIEFGEHVQLAPEVHLQLLVSGLQRLDHDHRVPGAGVDALSLRQENLPEFTAT